MSNQPLSLLPTTPIRYNEVFGPTIQGEGSDIGKPCFFIRTHGCPVMCPGCDTAFTWNGTEEGQETTTKALIEKVLDELQHYPHHGVVLSGGEPLLKWRDPAWHVLLNAVDYGAAWLALETSGFTSAKPMTKRDNLEQHHFRDFLEAFDTIHLSPKVTPCLHGRYSDEILLNDHEFILDSVDAGTLNLKLVVRDLADIEVVRAYNKKFEWQERGHRVFVMPFGQEPEEILETCRRIAPMIADTGFILSPRLHSLMWGKQRGV